MKLSIIYPIQKNNSVICKIIKKIKYFPIKCNVCGRITYAKNDNPDNIRESLRCHHCKATTRQRQMAKLICRTVSIKSLNNIDIYKGYIYNTESSGPIHNQLLKNKHYFFSEYFGNDFKSGEKVNGILNQDLKYLSFKDKYFDLVISSDVFEHIDKPYDAHKEVFRVLKNGGSHIFTIPFYEDQYLDETRAIIQNNKIEHLLKPLYHLDGIRPDEGILVFNIFSLEMLTKLKKIGFNTEMFKAITKIFCIDIHSSVIFRSTK